MTHDQDHVEKDCKGKGFMSSESDWQHLYGWTDCNRRDILVYYNNEILAKSYWYKWCMEGKYF